MKASPVYEAEGKKGWYVGTLEEENAEFSRLACVNSEKATRGLCSVVADVEMEGNGAPCSGEAERRSRWQIKLSAETSLPRLCLVLRESIACNTTHP